MMERPVSAGKRWQNSTRGLSLRKDNISLTYSQVSAGEVENSVPSF